MTQREVPEPCRVVWRRTGVAGSGELATLSTAERERAARTGRRAARERFVLGAVTLRREVAAIVGEPPDRVVVDRRCPTCGLPHGRPTLPGLGLHVSVTHSADVVGVAITPAGPVGLDVEAHGTGDVTSLHSFVLGDGEELEADDTAGFYRCWTRKEALVKATGDGIGIGLSTVRVTRPADAPRLCHYAGRPGLVAQMQDMAPADGYSACVAILTGTPIEVTERRLTAAP